jgi:hypothetical protein
VAYEDWIDCRLCRTVWRNLIRVVDYRPVNSGVNLIGVQDNGERQIRTFGDS